MWIKVIIRTYMSLIFFFKYKYKYGYYRILPIHHSLLSIQLTKLNKFAIRNYRLGLTASKIQILKPYPKRLRPTKINTRINYYYLLLEKWKVVFFALERNKKKKRKGVSLFLTLLWSKRRLELDSGTEKQNNLHISYFQNNHLPRPYFLWTHDDAPS